MEFQWVQHPTIIQGQTVNLLPLEVKHFDDLFEAASDKRIWKFYPGDWSLKDKFQKVYHNSLVNRNKGIEYPFVIYHKLSGKIIGSTRFLDIVDYDRRLEIGGTWIMPKYWASAINFDCKLALLTHCFEVLNTKRVQLKTQHNNLRSWKAIEKIGGIYEGIIRQHMLKDDGTFRSSAYFSILDEEWDTVKANIQLQLSKRIKT